MRHTVGFDRFNQMFESLLDDTSESFDNYPPYNIEKSGEDAYLITMAVAGFSMDDLTIVLENGVLNVSGKIRKTEEEDTKEYLHRGIATRSFERRFQLADHIHVQEATLKDGLLSISLERIVPEEKKPRVIEISKESKPLLGKSKK